MPSLWPRTAMQDGSVEAGDVVAVLDLLADAGIGAWVDGGWAVDALLGTQTRPHKDLDLAIPTADFARALESLGQHGFALVRDDGPHNQVVGDAGGRRVDLHAFDASVRRPGPDGFDVCGGDGLAYEIDGFDGTGTIAGRPVSCIPAPTLVRYHTGYEVDADDWHDVRLLCERFALPVPPDYERWTPRPQAGRP